MPRSQPRKVSPGRVAAKLRHRRRGGPEHFLGQVVGVGNRLRRLRAAHWYTSGV